MPTKILIVDDEPDLEKLIKLKFRRKIRNNELEFVAAYNGQEALEILQSGLDIDMVLTDINMPIMDGLTLLEKIRDFKKPFLKSVVVSAYGDMENIRVAMNRGAFDFVTKPINFEDLTITIEKTLGEIKLLRQAEQDRIQMQAIERELDIARNIQSSILPQQYPQNEKFELDALMETAKAVGGDLYDFFMIDEDRLGIVLGDVSGKGVPAAIFMAVCKTAIKSIGSSGGPVNECIKAVNNTLVQESPSNVFVTAIYGILDIRTGELSYCNAGHNPPYIISPNGKIKMLETIDGIPLGFMSNYQYTRQSVILNPGDTFFTYTDGVNEAMNNQEDEFSEERLETVLKEFDNGSLMALNQRIIEKIRQFTGGIPQSDDITMLALQYR